MALTGYKKVCGKNDGGVVTLALIEVQNVKEVTLDSESDSVSAVTLEAEGKFMKYQFAEDQCEFKETVTFENGSSKVEKSVQFKMDSMDLASRKAVEEIRLASYCGMIGLVKLPNGEGRLLGYSGSYGMDRPLRLQTAEGTTGKAFTDEHGEDVTIGCTHPEKSPIFTGDIDAMISVA